MIANTKYAANSATSSVREACAFDYRIGLPH